VPNFCPECGSSQATSRFCSSCGYSLASTPAPPDARTRVEDTPVFHPFAPPIVETWDSLAADPWSSTAGSMTPPPVRNVVTQTPVDLRSYQRGRLIKKLVMLRRLWGGVLIGVAAYGAVQFFSIALQSFISTEAVSAVLGLLGLGLLVAWPTLAGVATSAARQAGARAPHPALAVLLVVGTVFLAYILGGLISPDFSADTEAVLLFVEADDGARMTRYALALLLSGFFVYIAVLAPVVALSRTLKNRYPGDPLYRKTESGDQDAAPIMYESVHVGWWHLILSALILGTFDVITAGLFGVPDRFFDVFKGGGVSFGAMIILSKLSTFLADTVEFNRPIVEAAEAEIPWWHVQSRAVMVLLVVLLITIMLLFIPSLFG
jgi:hypothetical protein